MVVVLVLGSFVIYIMLCMDNNWWLFDFMIGSNLVIFVVGYLKGSFWILVFFFMIYSYEM